MKVSLSWLQSYVDLTGVSADDISGAITFLGFEVEQVIRTGAPKFNNVVVGHILTRDKHPNADKLSVCTVDVGSANGGVRTIVCGAPNCDIGNRVPVALPGAVLPGDFVIKEAKVRGQPSSGMMCSAKELTLAEDAQGLLLLTGTPDVGTAINDVLPAGDTVFDIEITPNRPDALSHLGVARELAAWFKKDLTYPTVRFTPAAITADPRADLLKSVRVEAATDCPLYTATVVTGVKVGPSPDWIQARLTAIGLRPINNIVDIGNYVMLEYGQPVHAFDAKKLAGAEIIVRHAAEGEKITTLDNKERVLSATTLVIADAQNPVVIAGIMGSADSGVSAETTDLVLEVAYFKRQSVRATVKRLGLASDSSYRYERGVDVHSLDEAAHRFIDLILAHAGGVVAGPIHRVGADIPWEREITVTPAYINEKLGFEIPAAEQRAALESLELAVVREEPTESRGPAWTFSVPSWRDDLDRPIDLVEEVVRLYGAEKIPSSVVSAPGLVGNDDPIVLFNRAVSAALVGQGFNECVNYTLRPAKELAAWATPAAIADLALSNPFVEDQSHLRNNLVSGLLESLKLNQSRGVAASHFFETGRVFIERNGSLSECVAAAFIIAEDTGERSWRTREAADFYTVKRHTATIASFAGIELERQPTTLVAAPALGWQEGHAATAGNIQHGWTSTFGLVSLAHLKALGITGKVYAGFFAIVSEKVTADADRRSYKPFGLQPAALRDLALIVPEAASSSEVQKALAKVVRAAVGNTFALEAVNVFDVYQGKGLPEGTKSLAYSLVFRAADRTLTDDEVNAVFTKIQDELVKATGYQIRK
ncbi:phenylalanine--tRNA ligase subunit beta [Rariglobus hedericola]|uniref:Phenylalanine--tRNA ligase beta subunit n=1 Tax=Rariglobus hedericola TaxID=2597822 RepID=A0A556QR21_9BACT|nr:phenylalanine--tRNA ligase subunit beta [Rariglobus hedericola]TSJ79087.1 phenylalanine--tRNA ligase subunit beta [Rariglobus hedericola]